MGQPNWLTNVNGILYFTSDDNDHGHELWMSDGTEAGTTVVKDIVAGSIGSDPSWLTNADGTLFFRANDGVNGSELFVLCPDCETAGIGFIYLLLFQ